MKEKKEKTVIQGGAFYHALSENSISEIDKRAVVPSAWNKGGKDEEARRYFWWDAQKCWDRLGIIEAVELLILGWFVMTIVPHLCNIHVIPAFGISKQAIIS